MLVAAALCPAPPLLAPELTGAAPALPGLARACADAVAALAAAAPDLVAVVTAGEATARHDPAGVLDLSAYRPGLPRPPAGGPPALPLGLGLGARLLDQAGYDGPRELATIGADETPAACAALGAQLAARSDRTALLVMADGTAKRTLRAPGYLDERAGPFDAEVERAVTAGDWPALLALDPQLAGELMASGRPSWQVLAGAFAPAGVTTQVRYSDAPFGVGYLVASMTAS